MTLHDERMRRFAEAGLYVVTSQALSRARSTLSVIGEALAGGARLIQLREKEMPIRPFLRLAEEARALTAARDALLIINDRLDVALAVGADGVHLGQDDFPIRVARRLAPDLILGASTHSEEDASAAQSEGASYVNIGPLFPTGTKSWTREFLGLEGLRRVAPRVSIPFTVMGGIKRAHVSELVAAGATTLAVVTAVTAADDVRRATREFLDDIVRARAMHGTATALQ